MLLLHRKTPAEDNLIQLVYHLPFYGSSFMADSVLEVRETPVVRVGTEPCGACFRNGASLEVVC